MPWQNLGPQGHHLRRWLHRSPANWRGTVTGAEWGAIVGVIGVVVFGGMVLNLFPYPQPLVESVGGRALSAAVTGVFCGGIVVVAAFAFGGAMVGAVIELWGRRPPDEAVPR